MLEKIPLLAVVMVTCSVIASCGDADDDNGPGPLGADPTDRSNFEEPAGQQQLAFGVQEGNIRNYFYRRGPVAAHLLTRSGNQPRIIVAFPAGNQGMGVWFRELDREAEFWAGDWGTVGSGGGVEGVVRKARDAAEKPMRGIRTTVQSEATSVRVEFAMMGNVRSLRDYLYGFDFSTAPELTNNKIDVVAGHDVVAVSRTQIGGDYHMELLLKGLDGTELVDNNGTIVIFNKAGIKFDLIALTDDDPLTPIEKTDLFNQTPADSFELDALAFLSYAEKLQAGSWRFLSYFGRDTLLSLRMLMAELTFPVIEAGLSSVIERINLTEDIEDPTFGFAIDIGDIAHEEELADFAAYRNSKEASPPADLRTPRYDYKMIDDDFILAPVLAEYFADYPASFDGFMARMRTSDNKTYQEAIEANLQLVLDRATPYMSGASPDNLVALKSGVPVGEWRDSTEGLGYGRVAFNVNVALVPAALKAAVDLYTRFQNSAKAAEAEALVAAWVDIDQHFLIDTVTGAQARELVTSYAGEIALDNSVVSQIPNDENLEYYAIALDDDGNKIPIMHSDHGFVMLFTDPDEAYLKRIARSITRTFPAGLFSDVGVMVANPALAGDATVTVPGGSTVKLTSIFTNSHYHGTVVWSWQQAMLAAGIRRQLDERSDDLQIGTVAALAKAECDLWATIDKANQVRAGELWTWDAVGGKPQYRFFGYNRSNDTEESNAAQLWSTVYLVVKPPSQC